MAERRATEPDGPRTGSPPRGRGRFRELDAYRVEREWRRYEGTAQRDLFRQLRVRLLLRHAATEGTVLEIGPGPGRFTPFVGRGAVHRVVLDLSKEMLTTLRTRWVRSRSTPVPDLILGDAADPPVRPGRCAGIVALGNPIGFAGSEALRVLDRAIELLAPGGRIVLETVAGPGERARYLARLPPGSVGRLFRSPAALLISRIDREGFEVEPDRDPGRHGFRRVDLGGVRRAFARRGVELIDCLAVAPSLGLEPERIASVAADPIAWARLLDVEEALGRRPERWPQAVSLLIAGVRGPPPQRPGNPSAPLAGAPPHRGI